jgi:hypothetical protein
MPVALGSEYQTHACAEFAETTFGIKIISLPAKLPLLDTSPVYNLLHANSKIFSYKIYRLPHIPYSNLT